MLQRFRERAESVKRRPLPPVGGEERTRFVEQAQLDFQDFAMVGDAQASIEEDGIVRYDGDGSGKHKAVIIAVLDDAAVLKAGDIFVI